MLIKAQRQSEIDVFRGIGIALVVLGHAKGSPELLHAFIYAFHMPAFFVLSGWLFNPEKPQSGLINYLAGKFKRLVVPAWCIGLLCGVVFLAQLATGGIKLDEFIRRFFGTITGSPFIEDNFNCTPIWFLFSLFVVEAISGTVSRCLSAWKHAWAFVCIGAGLLFALISGSIGYTPFGVSSALSALFFFGAGGLLRHYGLKFSLPLARKTVKLILMSLSAAIIISHIGTGQQSLDMSKNFFGDSAGNIITSLTVSLFGFFMIYFMSTVIAKSRPIEWLGNNTIPILGFNYVANSVVSRLLGYVYEGPSPWVLSFIVQMILLSVIAIILEKTPVMGRIINGRGG